MKKVKILIVEDDTLYATEVEMLVNRLGYDVVHVTDNSEDGLYMINVMEPDLVIMDINIEGKLNGIEVAELVSEKEIPVLFITSLTSQDLYERAKETSYVGYLIKPFDNLTLQSAIEFALQKLLQKDLNQSEFKGWKKDLVVKDCLLIKQPTALVKLPIAEITYVHSEGNYCHIYDCNGSRYLVNLSMVKLLEKLSSKKFLRIHKSYIVHLDYVSGIALGIGELTVASATLPVGRTFKDKLLSRFDVLG
jgi:DNA-binding LytR/AlgR family response regulator